MNHNDRERKWCVFLPCSGKVSWVVPQNCLAEIITATADTEQPPEQIVWRGQEIPVLDLGAKGDAAWREERTGTGLIAVLLGLEGGGCDYWGVALRGEGLGMSDLAGVEVTDVVSEDEDELGALFQLNGDTYAIPDLVEIQRQAAIASREA
jgi:hypothetical protein